MVTALHATPIRTASRPVVAQHATLTPALEAAVWRADAPNLRNRGSATYGRIFDTRRNQDGSFTVKVGTYPGGIIAVPNAHPSNVVTYSVSSSGKVARLAPTIPSSVSKSVLKADAINLRDVPDRSYGRIFSSTQNADGTWTLKVGTYKTSIAGSRPGAPPKQCHHLHGQPRRAFAEHRESRRLSASQLV